MRSSGENSLSSPVGMLGGLGTVLEVSVSQTSHLGAVWGGGGGITRGCCRVQTFFVAGFIPQNPAHVGCPGSAGVCQDGGGGAAGENKQLLGGF